MFSYKIVASFVVKKWSVATFVLTNYKLFLNFGQISGQLATFWSLLKTKTGKLADFANEIAPFPDDKHSYLYDIQQRQGDTRENFLRDVIALVKTDAAWPNYVSELRTWLNAKRVELGI